MPGLTPFTANELLTEEQYLDAQDEYGADSFTAKIGAEAIRDMLLVARPRKDRRRPARRDRRVDHRAEAQEAGQAPQDRRAVHRLGQQARVDDHDRHPGHSARTAPARPAGRRPLRHVRSQRPLSSRHQPQQPVEAPDRAACAGHHHPQRKAHAAGSCGRAVRQRPPRPHHHRCQQASAEVALATC